MHALALYVLPWLGQVSPPAEAPPAEAPPAAMPGSASPASEPPAADLTVTGQRPQGPAATDAVDVVDTVEVRQQAGDMGALLNRTQGVVLRRSGGLGSQTSFALHGLYGNRIRFFVDGVPSDLTGLGLGPADIPVNLIDAVEVYKGVVPIRFGADALGGAVNFVTRDGGLHDRMELAFELAAYGTFRGSAQARLVLVPDLGLVVGADAWFDRSDNDYLVEVETTNKTGKTQLETLRRFHDGFESYGVSAQGGVRGRRWADQLTLGVFTTGTQKDVQHNISMAIPYGDITRGEESVGGSLHYVLGDRRRSPLGVQVLASYAQRTGRVEDISRNFWDWHGDIVGTRPNPGERGRGGIVDSKTELAAGRLTLSWRLDEAHRFELSTSPTFSDERRVNTSVLTPDHPQTWQEYRSTRLISGASWQLKLWEGRIKNDLFAKLYYAAPEGETNVGPLARIEATLDVGYGDALRFELLPGLALKASFERATRVPGPIEYFGDGNQIDASTSLRAEVSDNANLGVALSQWETPVGRFSVDADVFYRHTQDLIFLSVVLESARYQSISDVDTLGVEGSLSWTGWNTLTLGVGGTQLEALNRSTSGPFTTFEGDRIPNLPYLYGNLNAALAFRDRDWLPPGLDQVRAYWYGRYVHEFFLFWESQGDKQYKLEVPSQLTQDVGLTLAGREGALSASFEVQNFTNEQVYDNIGVQLAGRSWHLKLVVGL